MADNRYYISKTAPFTQNGRPTHSTAIWLDRISTLAQGVFGFIGDNNVITADQITQGISNRVREIADRAYSYNADGTVNNITYTDPSEGTTLLTEDFTYNADGTVATREEMTATSTVMETYSYQDGLIDFAEIEINETGF